MKRVWTAEQRAAIDLRGTLLVAAGAGSGKTAVLIERILSSIMDSRCLCDVDEFLVVTYTKAAAMEMKFRLRAAIEETLRSGCGQVLNDHLLTQLLLINNASMTTLHAFGGNLLRQFFHVLGMEPNFRVMEETQTQILLRELLEALIDEAYERAEGSEEGSDFLAAVRFFADGYKDNALAETVLRVRSFAMSQPWPWVWLDGLAEAYDLEEEDFFGSPWGQALQEQSESLLEEAAWGLREAERLAVLPEGPREYAPALEQDGRDVLSLRRALERCGVQRERCGADEKRCETGRKRYGEEQKGQAELSEGCDESRENHHFKAFLEGLNQVKAGRLAPVKKKSLPQRDETVLLELKSEVQRLREGYKKILKGLKGVWIESSLGERLDAARPSGQIVRGVVEMTQRLMDVYRDEKRKRNCVDFSDLEHLPLELLRNHPEIEAVLRGRFREVLVDEYQDISPVQEELLKRLSQRGKQFLVGDIKQSIYRFRMADPGLFNEKYSSFLPWKSLAGSVHDGEEGTEQAACEEDYDGVVIDLRHNFRSYPMIIAAVNEVFGRLMKRETAEIDYDERAELVAAAAYDDEEDDGCGDGRCAVELHLVERPSGAGERTHTEVWSKGAGRLDDEQEEGVSEGLVFLERETARFEAYVVARRICRMVDEPGRAPDRSVRYRDIAVLMRSTSAVMRIYREVFDLYGIPFAADDGAGSAETMEREIAVALLNVIDNPHQDIPLLAVLHSFLVGLSAEQLSRIRLVYPEGDFYEAVCAVVWCAACEGDRRGWDEQEDGDIKGCWGEKEDRDKKEERKERDVKGGGAGSESGYDGCDAELAAACAEVLAVSEEGNLFPEGELEAIRGRARALLRDQQELAEGLVCFLHDLLGWRRAAAREALPEFVWRLFQETGMLHYVAAMPEGKRRQANLLGLYEEAVGFARDHSRSLASFLRFREKADQMKRERSAGTAMDEASDAVRFMTVHGSKGLEFPVVFVTGLGNRFNRRTLQEKVLLHKDLGMGIVGYDGQRRVTFPSPVRESVRWVLAREAVAEEMRVFYVAMTRAKEKLVLVGSSKDLTKSLQILCRPVAPESLSLSGVRNASSCLEWLEMALCQQEKGEDPWRLFPYAVSDMLKIMVEADNRMKPSLFVARDFDPDAVTLEELDKKLLWRYGHVDHLVKTSVSGISKLREPDAFRPLLAEEDAEAEEEGFAAAESGMAGEWDAAEELDTVEEFDTAAKVLKKAGRSTQKGQAEARALALERGRVTHKFFQLIPWRLWSGEWEAWNDTKRRHILRGHLHNLVERELISPDMCEEVPLERAAFLLSSSLGERIFAADELYTEMPFILGMAWGADRQRVLVQGAADLVAVYHEADGRPDRALVIDFKTDRVRYDSGVDVLTERYALQLAIYSEAAQKLLGVDVEESLIYAINAGWAVRVGKERLALALAEAELGVDEGA